MPNNNTVKKYDLDGNLVATKTINDAKVYDVILNKVVIIRNNELILKDFDTEEELKVTTLDFNYSGYQFSSETYHVSSEITYYNGNLYNNYYKPVLDISNICTLENQVEKEFKSEDFYGKKDIPNGFQILFKVDMNKTEDKDINKGAYLYTITDNNDIVINTFKSGGQCF